jgi:hypothetical protein
MPARFAKAKEFIQSNLQGTKHEYKAVQDAQMQYLERVIR